MPEKPARIFLSPPHMSGREREYIGQVFDQNWIAPVGPHITKFEQAFAERIGVAHAAAVASGTAALHLALRYLNLQPGDEVLCSTFTFCASANPIVYEKAIPVFIDSDAETWNMDPQLVEEELEQAHQRGRLPRAIVAVDILGQSADIAALRRVADRFAVPIIEDAAEALGATYNGKPVGASSWTSAFSFNGNKIITTSGGGMLCSNDQKLIEHTRFLATQAKDPGPIYLHSHIGYNYRLSNVLAAVGIGQLEVLDDRVAARRQVAQYYQDTICKLPGISFMPEASFGISNRWLSVICVDPVAFGASCEDIRLALEEENIESRRAWLPLHQQPVFADCRVIGGHVAESIFECSLCLPSGSALQVSDLERIVACVQRCGK